MWSASDISKTLPIRSNDLEFQDSSGEWQHFTILVTRERIVFGGVCNTGFIESGYLDREEGETIDEGLQELLADLEVYYNDGPKYVSRIICNERM
jgi:hypothetical protein